MHKRNTSIEYISPFLEFKLRSRCDHYVIQLTNAELLSYLNFLSTGIFCSLWLSELPVAFDTQTIAV